MSITKKMISVAHDVMLRRGDFVLSARLIEEIYEAMRNKEPLENRELLEQQLAEREKQVAMLRSYLNRWAFTQSEDECAHMEVQEALAATTDLKCVILCHAEPVGWCGTSGVGELIVSKSKVWNFLTTPLYRAWEPHITEWTTFKEKVIK